MDGHSDLVWGFIWGFFAVQESHLCCRCTSPLPLPHGPKGTAGLGKNSLFLGCLELILLLCTDTPWMKRGEGRMDHTVLLPLCRALGGTSGVLPDSSKGTWLAFLKEPAWLFQRSLPGSSTLGHYPYQNE